MDPKMKEVTLETLKGGAAPELWQMEFERVLENIQDPQTDPEAKRKITLEVVFSPNETREDMIAEIKVKSKLAPPKPEGAIVYMGRKEGRLVALGYDPRQGNLFGDEEKDPDVTPIDTRKEGESA